MAALLAAAAFALPSPVGCNAAGGCRPCRAVDRRLYDELRQSIEEDEADSDGGDAAGDGDGDGDEDDRSAARDVNPYRQHQYAAVDGQPRRGVRWPASHAAATAAAPVATVVRQGRPYDRRTSVPGNGLRAPDDAALLRGGETVELPTYVNVPVTLRCRFAPLEGTDDKFETVVESVYPGHADAPPPPSVGSRASRILRQLVASSADRNARPVRRVPDDRLGQTRTSWPVLYRHRDVDDDDDWRPGKRPRPEGERYGGEGYRGRRPYAGDAVGRQIAARRLAAELARPFQQWFRTADRRNVPARTENELVDDRADDEQTEDDDGRRQEQAADDPSADGERETERADDPSADVERADDPSADEERADDQSAYEERAAERMDDSRDEAAVEQRADAREAQDEWIVPDIGPRPTTVPDVITTSNE